MASWEEAMVLLARGRGPALMRYGYLLCGSESDAADLVQEALVRVFSGPRRRWTNDEAEAYVRKTMLHFHLDQRRRHRRWLALLPRLADRTESQAILHTELRTDVTRLLQELSPRQRACVVLFYYQDLSLRDIAELLGCGIGTVKRHLDDARNRLSASWRATHEG